MLIFLGISLAMDNDRVVLRNNGNYNVLLSRTLMDKFGYVDIPQRGFKHGRHIAETKGDMTEQTIPTLFVYCNVLEHVVVGDIMTPLLCMVNMNAGKRTEKMHETPHDPLYVPLQKKYFDNIMTDMGEPVYLADGKMVTILEFKRIGLLDNVV